MTSKILICLSLAFALQGCGGSSSNNGGGSGGGSSVADTPEMKAAQDKCANTPTSGGTDIRYVYSENNNGNACTTGCQIFHSSSDYCSGLQNASLNNNCAASTRAEDYQKYCASGN